MRTIYHVLWVFRLENAIQLQTILIKSTQIVSAALMTFHNQNMSSNFTEMKICLSQWIQVYIYIYMGISKKLCSNFDNLYFEKYCCKILNIYTTLWSQNKTGWGRLSIGRLLSQIGLGLEFLGYFGYFYHEMRSRARSFGDGEWCVSFLWHTYIQLEYYRRHAYILFDTTLLFTFHTLIQSYFEIRNTTSILLECYAW